MLLVEVATGPGFSKIQTTLEILAREYPIHMAIQQGAAVLLIILATFALAAIKTGDLARRARPGGSSAAKE